MRISSAKTTIGVRAATKCDSRECGSTSRRERSERCPPPKIETLSENSGFVFFKEGQLFQYFRGFVHMPHEHAQVSYKPTDKERIKEIFTAYTKIAEKISSSMNPNGT